MLQKDSYERENLTFNIDLTDTGWLSTKRINRLRYSNGGGVINVETGAKSPVKIYWVLKSFADHCPATTLRGISIVSFSTESTRLLRIFIIGEII